MAVIPPNCAFSYTVNDFKTSLTQSEKSVGLMPSGEISFQKGDVRVLGDVMQASLERLNRNPNGFFMLFECSLPDKGGHSSDMYQSVFGTLRTDWLVKTAVDFALTHPGTLVVVTADHETGGLTLVQETPDENISWQEMSSYGAARPQNRKYIAKFSTTGHSGCMVPVYAYGPGAEEFTGIMENTAFKNKILKLLNIQ